MKRIGALGPPGTGKTTFGTRIAGDRIREFGSDGVAYLAFTRAAAEEALTRIGGHRDTHPHFRTLHSLCFRLLKQSNPDVRVMTTGDFKQFARETGLDGAYTVGEWEDMAEVMCSLANQGRTEWDACRTAYALSRLSARDADGLDRAKHEIAPVAIRQLGRIESASYRTFVKLYDEFRRKNGLIDFTDMLEHAVRFGEPLDIPFVVADECQDLCPIHHAILDRLFSGSEQLWYIGDDDQAIYNWSGASADLFLDRLAGIPKVTLRQTHRFGQGIVDFGATIIRRVKRRIEKDVIGVPGKHGKIDVMGRFEPAPGRYFILHRHVAGCNEIARLFIERGLPFVNERGKSPMEAASRVKAFSAIPMLAGGGRVAAGRALLLVEDLMPSVATDGAGKIRLVVHGGKARAEKLNPNRDVSLDDLVGARILTPEGARAIRERRYGLLKHSADLEYYDRVLRNGYELGPGGPTITTIHGSKGRQAPHVVVFAEASRRCWDDPDAEHRLAYVAATRTEGDLTVCLDRRVDWATHSYSYPIEQNHLTAQEILI